jgi:hypothetical protein
VARRTGLTVAQVRRALGLPATIPPGARLGRLRRRYGLQMTRVRELLARAGGTAGSSGG